MNMTSVALGLLIGITIHVLGSIVLMTHLINIVDLKDDMHLRYIILWGIVINCIIVLSFVGILIWRLINKT